MTNFEYWKDRILEIARGSGSFALLNEEPVGCLYMGCSQCGFHGACSRNRIEWLYAEHGERPKLTAKERMFCELVETGWIARDKSGFLYFYHIKPNKTSTSWLLDKSVGWVKFCDLSEKLPFSFIKWEDKEAWSVEDLLKLEVEE